MGEIRVLNEHGDETIAWDPEDRQEVDAAKERFGELKKQGYEFFTVEETKGKKVEKFSKTLGKLIAAPGGRTAADREAGTRPRAMAGGPNATLTPTDW